MTQKQKQKRLTKRQKLIHDRLHPTYKDAYIVTLTGRLENMTQLRALRAAVSCAKYEIHSFGRDKLKQKGKGAVLAKYIEAYDIEERELNIPENKRAIGIEIECTMPLSADEINTLLAKEKVRLKGVCLTNDGSVRASESDYSYEFRVVTTQESGYENLRQLLAFINKHGASVNASCGLHVHLDMRREVKCPLRGIPIQPIKNLKAALPLLTSMVPSARRNDYFCRRNITEYTKAFPKRRQGESESECEERSIMPERYTKINVLAYQTHRTYEVRLHSGTTSFEKIKNWCEVLSSIAYSKNTINTASPTRLARELLWSPELLAYVKTRVKKFLKETPQQKRLTKRIPASLEERGMGYNYDFNYEEAA